MIENCEFCPVSGAREKFIPYGNNTSHLVIVEPGQNIAGCDFVDALVMARYACQGADEHTAMVACGIFLRMAMKSAWVIVIPSIYTEEFFGKHFVGVELLKGKQVISYIDLDVAKAEYKRVTK